MISKLSKYVDEQGVFNLKTEAVHALAVSALEFTGANPDLQRLLLNRLRTVDVDTPTLTTYFDGECARMAHIDTILSLMLYCEFSKDANQKPADEMASDVLYNIRMSQ